MLIQLKSAVAESAEQPILRMDGAKKTLALDSSKISAYLKCPQYFQYAYMEHLESVNKPNHFWVGTAIHAGLETTYKAMKTGRPILEAGMVEGLNKLKEMLADPEADKIDDDYKKFVIKRFREYVMFLDVEFEDIDPEVTGAEVGFSEVFYEDDEWRFVLEGKIDLLLRSRRNGKLYFVDHKTQQRLYDYYGYSIQFLNYALVTGAEIGQYYYFGLQKVASTSSFRFSSPYRMYSDLIEMWKNELIVIYKHIYAYLNRPEGEEPLRNRTQCLPHGQKYPCAFHILCNDPSPITRAQQKLVWFKEREPWHPWAGDKDELDTESEGSETA